MTVEAKFIIEESEKYKGLTLREKAIKAVAEMGETRQIIKVAWMMEIEKALYAQIEEAAKLTDDEAIRLETVSMEYKQKGDSETAIRFSANVVTAAKLGRDIRALAGVTKDDGPDDRFDLGGFECNEKQED